MKKEKIQFTVLSVSGLLTLIGILIALNFISHFIFIRFDCTRNRIYSLSKYSKQLVRSIEDPIIIKAYFSETLPPEHAANRKYLERLLEEFRVYANGKVKVEFVRYSDPKKFESEAQRQGIPPLRFDQVTHDKYEVQVGYMGLTINYMDNREVIPVVTSIQGLEYDLTSLIRKLVSTKKTRIGFLIGHDEVDVLANQDELAQRIERDYNIYRADLAGGTTLPLDCAALLIIGPQKEISATDLFAIDQFLMQGKPIAICAGRMKADLETFRVNQITSHIEKLAEFYGVSIKQGLVVDPQCQRIAVTQRQGIFSIQNIIDFQYVPQIVRMISDNPMVKDLNSISFPFVSPLELSVGKQPNVEAKELFRSSKHSFVQDRVYSINPFSDLAPSEPGKRASQLLGVVLNGSWKSFYQSEPVPDKVSKSTIISEGKPTRMLIIGTGGLFDTKMPIEKNNLVFFSNVLDWLTQDEALIAVRSKGVSYQPIGELSAWKRSAYKLVNMFCMPLIMIGVGIFRWWMRKSYKEKIALEFKAGVYVK